MPRSARIDAPGVLHHIIGRGIERREIFISNEDRDDFLSRVARFAESEAFEVYAWALMANHFHLLCKTNRQPISVSMHRLLTGYVVNFNRRHRRHGYLFQNRFKSIICQEDLYFREVVRYIHLNPMRSGWVADLHRLEDFPFTGHSAVLGRVERPWQSSAYVLSFFGNGCSAREGYREFVSAGLAMGRRPELVGGGLVRSQGGWSEVQALRRKKAAAATDPRILGDSDFVGRLTSQADERTRDSLRLQQEKPPIERIGRRVCETFDLSPAELCSGSRRRPAVRARRAISWIAVTELGYSGAEVARYLGVSGSCVTRFVAAGKGPDVAEVMEKLEEGTACIT
jgi:REP element-mobilizing transposase RayT